MTRRPRGRRETEREEGGRTSDLLFELHDDLDGHVEDAQLGLRLVRLEVLHAHAAQLLERLVDVADPNPAPHTHTHTSTTTWQRGATR